MNGRAHGALLAAMIAFAAPAQAAGAVVQTGLDLVAEGAAAVRSDAGRTAVLRQAATGRLAWAQPAEADGRLRHRAHLSVLSLAGRGPTAHLTGDFLGVSNIEAGSGTRLYSAWWEASRRDWSLRAGALLADEEFAGTSGGANFLNSSFGWPAFISANTRHTGPAFPTAAAGLRLERALGRAAVWRVGIYDGDTLGSAAGAPARHRLGGDQGWFVITEVSVVAATARTRGKAGAWLHTADFADVRLDVDGLLLAETGARPRAHSGNGGGFAALEHALAGERGKAGALELFLRAGVSPADRSAIAWGLDAGLAWNGPLPARRGDVLALGVSHGQFSRHRAQHLRTLDPAVTLGHERVIELLYRFVLSERVCLTPDLQVICNPEGSATRRDACVALLRLNASL